MNYDDILVKIGGIGRYQIILLILVSLPVCFDGMTTVMLVFILGHHPHRCRIPFEDRQFSSSSFLNSSGVYNASQCSLTYNGTTTPCTDWVYDSQYYKTSLISKFNMVCENKFMRSHILLSHFLGSFTNALLGGIMSDLWGRKPVFVIGIILMIVPNVARPWLSNIFLVAVGEFLNATGSNICYVVPFTIVTELVGPAHRVLASFVIYFSYCIGSFIVLLYAYFIREWETLIVVISAPIVVCLFIFFFVTESPRWLLSKGKTEEAMNILRRIAKFNNSKFDVVFNEIDDNEDEHMSTLQTWGLLIRSKRMMLYATVLIVNWFTLSFIYFGITMNTSDLGGNVYINYAISTSMETLAVILCIFVNLVPRKRIFSTSVIVCGVVCLCTIFTSLYGNNSLHWLTITLAMIGKLMITTGVFMVYIITSEIFPTTARASMFGVCNAAARIGGITSSYVGKLGVLVDTKFGLALPLIIFGSFGLLAGLMSLLLPETRNIPLPERFEDIYKLNRKKQTNTSHNGEEMLMVPS